MSVDSSARCPSTRIIRWNTIRGECTTNSSRQGGFEPRMWKVDKSNQRRAWGPGWTCGQFMTTPPTSEGSRGKRVMGWATKDRGAEKGQTSTGRKTQGLSFPTDWQWYLFLLPLRDITALTYVDGLPLLLLENKLGLMATTCDRSFEAGIKILFQTNGKKRSWR